MRIRYFFALSLFTFFFIFNDYAHSIEIEFKNDNGDPAGNAYQINRRYFEESVVLQPNGPCNIHTIKIYYSGDEPAKDTLWICGYPTAGNLYPTQYIWDYNSLIPPIEVEYDGTPGWMEIDVSNTGLRSDGYDRIVIQHRIKPDGPWFTYDSDGRQSMPSSWICDPFTPNPNFYGIRGTIYHNPGGDYLIRLILEYDYPDGTTSAPPPPPTMVDVTSSMGLTPHRYSSVSDLNSDGFDEILLSGRIYKNIPNNSFELLTTISAAGTTVGDIDNDGDKDIYSLRNGSKDFDKRMVNSNDGIYLNDGDENFTKVDNNEIFDLPYPDPSVDFDLNNPSGQTEYFNPYDAITPLFFDYNGDGWLDLFIANRRIEISGNPELYCPDQLWKNNGNGTFTNVRESSGISDGEPFSPYQPGVFGYGYYDCYGAAATDYNNDNKTDIFVANYRLIKDNLYKNNDDGTFTEVGAETGVEGIPTNSPNYFGHGMGCQWGDFNNDALPDLCVGNLAHTDSRGASSNPSLIFRNDGAPDYHFTNVQPEMVLKFHEGNAGVLWLDLNCDGLLDLWHGKYSGGFGSFYLNTGPPNYKLQEITWKIGAIVNNSWTASKLDYDNDGDLDMIVQGRLFRNDIPRQGKWLALRIEGDPENNVSLDCFGSKIIAYSGEKLFYRELMGSASGTLCTQNTNEIHFGLGEIETIDSVVVIYPNGKKNVLLDLIPNSRYTIPYMEAAQFSPKSAPGLIEPMNFASIESSTPVFEWTELGSAVSYSFRLFQMDTNREVINEIKIKDISNNTVDWSSSEFDALSEGETYFWDVSAKFKNNEGDPIEAHRSTTNVFTVGIPKPLGITLIQPENGASGVLSDAEFKWTSAKYHNTYASVKTYYHLMIADDEEFNDIIIDIENLESVSITKIEELIPGNSYFWKVKAYNDKWESPWSEAFSFTMLALPIQPTLISPENHATDVDLRPVLSWNEVEGSEGYFLQISKDQDFEDVFYDISTSSNQIKVIKKHDKGTKHFWRVRAENEAGFGAWAEIWDYTTEGVISVNQNHRKIFFSCSPNPFYDQTDIRIALETPEVIELSVYNVLGEKIDVIVSDQYLQEANFKWQPESINSGLYLLKLKANNRIFTEKVIYIK